MDKLKQDFVKQYGLNHKIQRLYIHWDITTFCEYDCSYCYAKKEYGIKWNNPGIWSKQLLVINELKKSSLPIFLGLLGGEPTSHYKYFELLTKLSPIILNNKDSRLYITTNGSKDNDFFEKHPSLGNQFYFLFSLHPEYINETNFLNFQKNIEIVLNKGYRVKVNVMLHPSKRYWNNLKYFIEELQKLNIDVHPHYIYGDVHNKIRYTDEFYQYFNFINITKKPEFIFETQETTYQFNDHDIFNNNYNQFLGWNCYNNNFEIDLDCRINQFCFGDKRPIKKDFFKNITEIVPKKCPHNFCSCDGLLKIYKEK